MSNYPKLLNNDTELFQGIILDFFPDYKLSSTKNMELEIQI